ncbi:type 2 lanthipeptide synthetase LanM (plasmid) [Clostridium perfringens]|uniref:Putative lacticin modification enzyme n=1 Tax=Clostridium perfringens TaxID=1502 RepID=A0A2X2Y944_CLOPF|nr:type 2 lanthipeptide synthetase LanM [Clostridium perfringens]NGT74029.1 type 2 lantipeptide synthetase LanM [Clostridium perfringens]SQB59473.1 putative lacticin modification enzyme [Clostridium perfringens]
MKYELFNNFISQQINYIGKEYLLELERYLPEKLYINIYEHLKLCIENDFIRVLYSEYTLFKQENNVDEKVVGDILEKFLEYTNSNKFTWELYRKYPLLKEEIELQIKDYSNHIITIYERFNRDKEEIKKNINKDPGEILNIISFEGDIHNGKSTSKIITEKSTLYYKPYNAKTLELFYKILNIVSKNINNNSFYKINYYSSSSYMWMELVEAGTCSSIDEVKDYYYKSGIYLLVFYLLSSYDMHYENVISRSDGPVIIDFETISLAPITPSLEINNFKEPTNSVLNTAFIPYINDDGAFDINLSGILSQSVTSERDEGYYYVANKIDGFKIAKTKVYLDVKSEITLNNSKISSRDISLEEIRLLIRKGFSDSAHVALLVKKEIKEVYKSLIDEDNMLIRQLLRPTQVYNKFIEAAKHPDILKSKSKLEKLFLILEDNFNPSEHGYIRVQEEISQMRKGYIPIFHSKFNSRDLYSNEEKVCIDYFTETIYDYLTKKIDAFNEKQIEYQMNLIDYSILTLTTQEDFVETVNITEDSSNKKINECTVNTLIKELLDKIEANAIYFDNDISTVLNPHISPHKIMWKIKDLGINLYEDGGMILLFAYYGYYNNEERYIRTSLRFLNYMNFIQVNTDNYSVFSGLGSLIYLNYNIFKLLENIEGFKQEKKQYKEFIEKTINIILNKAEKCEFKAEDFDFMNGIISSIFLICKIYMENKDNYPDIKDRIVKIKNRILDSFNESWINQIGFAHGITGISLSLAKIYEVSKDKKLLRIINRLILRENKYISEVGIDNIAATWCKGITGIILGRNLIFESLQNTLEIEEFKSDILCFNEDYIKNILINNDVNNKNFSLCHGLFGNIEILKKLNYMNEIEKILNINYFKSFNDLVWVKGLNVSVDTFMIGNSGIAYVLLEIYNKSIPSILSLDIMK